MWSQYRTRLYDSEYLNPKRRRSDVFRHALFVSYFLSNNIIISFWFSTRLLSIECCWRTVHIIIMLTLCVPQKIPRNFVKFSHTFLLDFSRSIQQVSVQGRILFHRVNMFFDGPFSVNSIGFSHFLHTRL